MAPSSFRGVWEIVYEVVAEPVVKRFRLWRSGLELSALERELIDLLHGMQAETTRTLQIEMLDDEYQLAEVRAALLRLKHLGLVESRYGWYHGVERDRQGGSPASVHYQEDWWSLTEAGQDAAGFI